MKFQVLFLPLIRGIIIKKMMLMTNRDIVVRVIVLYDPSQETELSGMPRTMSDPTGCLALLTTSQTKK